MQYLKQSTAATVLIGPVLDADGAAVTGAVIGDFRLAKNGTVTTMSGNTISHSHNGCYLISLTTANTDTLDRLSISMGNTAYGMTVFRYTVLTAAQYDALIANGTITPAAIEAALVNEGDATALLQAIADKIAGDLTAGDLTALAIVSAIKADATLAQMISRIDVATSSRLASASYTAPPTAATIADAVWDEPAVDHTSTGSFGWILGILATLVENVTGWRFTAKALENAASSTGSGARSVSITVLLDEIAQQSALVRLVKGAEKYLATTDEDGLAEFSVNDGTWRVSITLANTQFTPVDLVVNANVSQSYSLTALPALEASDPNMITGYWLCLSQAGTPESGVQITLTAMSLPANSTGLILDSASRSATTGADGIASFTNLIPGVRYKVKRNSGREFYFVCPDYQSDPVDLASFIGT